MKSKTMNVIRYDADDGMVFDWKNIEDHLIENEDGTTIQEHLYVKTIFIGELDSIDNYIEVKIDEYLFENFSKRYKVLLTNADIYYRMLDVGSKGKSYELIL